MNIQKIGEAEVCQHNSGFRCMSWSAVVVGAFVALGLSFLINLFGIAIGLSAFTTTSEGILTLAIGGYVGMLIGIIAIMYFSGWVAGYLGRAHCFGKYSGALYGFTAWCVALILMILLASQTAQFVSANFYSLTNSDVEVVRLVNVDVSAQSVTSADRNSKAAKAEMKREEIAENKTAKAIGQSLFMMFALFFVGAISSAIGGYCGSNPKNTSCTWNKD